MLDYAARVVSILMADKLRRKVAAVIIIGVARYVLYVEAIVDIRKIAGYPAVPI